MAKHCEFCGRFFVPDPRVGDRQRSCFRPECQEARKRASKRAWRERETPRGYFAGRYAYLKEWRRKRRFASTEVIQDEIRLRRLTQTEFAAPGVTRRMIQDAIPPPP